MLEFNDFGHRATAVNHKIKFHKIKFLRQDMPKLEDSQECAVLGHFGSILERVIYWPLLIKNLVTAESAVLFDSFGVMFQSGAHQETLLSCEEGFISSD